MQRYLTLATPNSFYATAYMLQWAVFFAHPANNVVTHTTLCGTTPSSSHTQPIKLGPKLEEANGKWRVRHVTFFMISNDSFCLHCSRTVRRFVWCAGLVIHSHLSIYVCVPRSFWVTILLIWSRAQKTLDWRARSSSHTSLICNCLVAARLLLDLDAFVFSNVLQIRRMINGYFLYRFFCYYFNSTYTIIKNCKRQIAENWMPNELHITDFF